MSIEIETEPVCHRCGRKYQKLKGFFPVCYQQDYKGVGHLPICKECLNTIYQEYYDKCKDEKSAVRQVCRRLNLYWNDGLYQKSRKWSGSMSVISQYLAGLNNNKYVGKCYDDTLTEEGTLWDFRGNTVVPNAKELNKVLSDEDGQPIDEQPEEDDGLKDIDPKVIRFWGEGFTSDMYNQLEDRRKYWMSRLPNEGRDIDIGTEAIIRQICSLELDINRDRIAGKAVDKSVNALNNLLGSANLKPVQKKNESDASIDNTPFGVWIQRFETERPIPEPDPEMQDTDGIIKYITTWFYGHLGKSLGVKNVHSKLYDEEIKKLSVDKPEYEDEDDIDDDELLYDVFGDKDNDKGTDNNSGGGSS